MHTARGGVKKKSLKQLYGEENVQQLGERWKWQHQKWHNTKKTECQNQENTEWWRWSVRQHDVCVVVLSVYPNLWAWAWLVAWSFLMTSSLKSKWTLPLAQGERRYIAPTHTHMHSCTHYPTHTVTNVTTNAQTDRLQHTQAQHFTHTDQAHECHTNTPSYTHLTSQHRRW